MSGEKLIVALDYPGAREALEMVRRLEGLVSFYKVGLELFTAAGPGLVEKLKAAGKRVFLDLKFFDIPATMAGAARAAAGLGVDMLNLHLLAGTGAARSLREAVCAKASGEGLAVPMLLGVTVLTSSEGREWLELGLAGEPARLVELLAARAREAGLDGVVASAHEARALKEKHGSSFLVVTPGIRPAGEGVDDQRRVATPAQALAAGSDFLVVGRPVTGAPDPAAACARIIEECRAFNASG